MKFITPVIVAATLAATSATTTPVAKDPAFQDLEMKVNALMASQQIEVRSLKAKIAALEGKTSGAKPGIRRRRAQEDSAEDGLAEAQAAAEEALDAGLAEAPEEVNDILGELDLEGIEADPQGGFHYLLYHILKKVKAVEYCVDYYYDHGGKRRLEEGEDEDELEEGEDPEGGGHYRKGTCVFGAKAKKVEINSKKLEINAGYYHH